jgi:hypothetical protein
MKYLISSRPLLESYEKPVWTGPGVTLKLSVLCTLHESALYHGVMESRLGKGQTFYYLFVKQILLPR